MKRYSPSTFTYGFELEVGDVDRRLDIPSHLGKWEQSELDIVNLYSPYHGVAADPLGIDPPIGGEVNIYPARSPEELGDRVGELLDWFRQQHQWPTVSHRAHSHVHIRVPGLRDDIEALKRLTWFIFMFQDDVFEHMHHFEERPEILKSKEARNYLKWDGARRMPEWLARNIVDKARDFDDFIRLQCCGRDGVSRGRPIRYGINTYCMKHIDTIEFRFFRGTLLGEDVMRMAEFARDFISAGLRGSTDFNTYLWCKRRGWSPPRVVFDLAAQLGWEKTRHTKDRGQKRRELIEI